MSTCSMGKCVTFLYVIIFTHVLCRCYQLRGADVPTYGFKFPQKGLKEYESSIHPKYNNYLYPIDVYQNPLIGEDITQQFTKIIKDKMDKPDTSYRMKKVRHKHSLNQYVSSDQNKKNKQFDMYQNPMIGEDITQQFSKIIKEKLKHINTVDAPHKREVGNQNQPQQDELAVQTESPAEVQSSRSMPEGLSSFEAGRISRRQGGSECSEAEQSDQSSNDDEEDDSSKDANSSNSYLKQNLHVQYPPVGGTDMMSIMPKLNSESNGYSNTKSESKLDLDEDLHPPVQSLRQGSSYPTKTGGDPSGSVEAAAGDAIYQNHTALSEMQKARPYVNSEGDGGGDSRLNVVHLQGNVPGKLPSTTTGLSTLLFPTSKCGARPVTVTQMPGAPVLVPVFQMAQQPTSTPKTSSCIPKIPDAPILVSMLQMAQRPTPTPRITAYVQTAKGNMGAAPNVGSVITQIYNMLVADGTSRMNLDASVTGAGSYELRAREKEVEVRFYGNPSTAKFPRGIAKSKDTQPPEN